MSELSVYEAVGGESFFFELVEQFYQGVENDQLIRPLYPADLEPGKRALALFLVQYFGGPSTYSQERGHPRLRARHLPFAIGTGERDAWVKHMLASLDRLAPAPEVRAQMAAYFDHAATFMINRSD